MTFTKRAQGNEGADGGGGQGDRPCSWAPCRPATVPARRALQRRPWPDAYRGRRSFRLNRGWLLLLLEARRPPEPVLPLATASLAAAGPRHSHTITAALTAPSDRGGAAAHPPCRAVEGGGGGSGSGGEPPPEARPLFKPVRAAAALPHLGQERTHVGSAAPLLARGAARAAAGRRRRRRRRQRHGGTRRW